MVMDYAMLTKILELRASWLCIVLFIAGSATSQYCSCKPSSFCTGTVGNKACGYPGDVYCCGYGITDGGSTTGTNTNTNNGRTCECVRERTCRTWSDQTIANAPNDKPCFVGTEYCCSSGTGSIGKKCGCVRERTCRTWSDQTIANAPRDKPCSSGYDYCCDLGLIDNNKDKNNYVSGTCRCIRHQSCDTNRDQIIVDVPSGQRSCSFGEAYCCKRSNGGNGNGGGVQGGNGIIGGNGNGWKSNGGFPGGPNCRTKTNPKPV